jgi:hypothetical protein
MKKAENVNFADKSSKYVISTTTTRNLPHKMTSDVILKKCTSITTVYPLPLYVKP